MKSSLIIQLLSCYYKFKLSIWCRVLDNIVNVHVLFPYDQPEGKLNFEIIIFVVIYKYLYNL